MMRKTATFSASRIKTTLHPDCAQNHSASSTPFSVNAHNSLFGKDDEPRRCGIRSNCIATTGAHEQFGREPMSQSFQVRVFLCGDDETANPNSLEITYDNFGSRRQCPWKGLSVATPEALWFSVVGIFHESSELFFRAADWSWSGCWRSSKCG